MKTSALLAQLSAAAILLLAFGLSVYRAKTQPIAHDEALSYEWFLDQGVANVLQYSATNHVLQTLLTKPIVKIFGVSEFKLRIPSLLGAAVYLVATYLLCRRLFGAGLVFVLCVAMLALNPQVRDFMAAARGYSLGLACLAVAMYWMARLAERGQFDAEQREWRLGCTITSVCLALSVAANLTNILPAVSLGLAFSLVAFGELAKLLQFRSPRLRSFAKYFVFPGAFAGFCILWPYLIQFRAAQTYAGFDSAPPALRDLFAASFLYWTDDSTANLGAVPALPGSLEQRAADLGAFLILPLLFCLVVAGLLMASDEESGLEKVQRARCRIFAGAAIFSVALTLILHVAAGTHYPASRLCLFLIPLFTLGAGLSARELASRFPSPFLKGFGLLISASVISVYAQSLNAKTFRYNGYDSISRDLYNAIENDARSRGLTEGRVAGTWWYEPEINFYRVRDGAKWMLPYDVKDPSSTWQTPGTPDPSAYDYFLFTPANDPHLAGPRIRTIFHDDKTQTTILAIGHD